MPILRAFLLGQAVSPDGGEAMVVLVEPNGDESRVVCRLKGSTTEIDFTDGHQPDYFHERYGGPNAFSSVVRRAALGLSRRDDSDPLPASRSIQTDFILQRTTEAFEFARKAHGGQARKGSGVPYLSHLMAVAALVLEYGGDEDEAIAALLHDAPEDAGGQPVLDEIRRIFGVRVARIVWGCTDTLESPKPEWQKRKEDHLARMPEADSSILLVLAADKLYNTQSIQEDRKTLGEQIWARFRGGREGMLWYLEAFSVAIFEHPECVGSVRRLALRLRIEVDRLRTEECSS